MKLVTATINEVQLDHVRDALDSLGVVDRIAVSELRCFGRTPGPQRVWRGTVYNLPHVLKLRVEVAVEDDDVERVGAAIAVTDPLGETAVWVLPLQILEPLSAVVAPAELTRLSA